MTTIDGLQFQKVFEAQDDLFFKTIESFKFDDKIATTAKRMGFSADQATTLNVSVYSLLLNLLQKEQFGAYLESEVNISSAQAETLANELIDFVVTPFTQELDQHRKAMAQKEEDEIEIDNDLLDKKDVEEGVERAGDLEIVDGPKSLDEIEKDPYLEKVIDEDEEEQKEEEKQTEKEFEKSEIKLEDAKPNLADYSPYQKESRNELLAGLEHPPEGKISFYTAPKNQIKAAQSFQSTAPIFKTSTTVPVAIAASSEKEVTLAAQKNNVPITIPVSPKIEAASPEQKEEIHTQETKIPITVSAPPDLPTEESVRNIPIQSIIPQKPQVVANKKIIETIKTDTAGFASLAKPLKTINVFTVNGMTKTSVQMEHDPLENPLTKRDMDAKLREAAQSRQQAFVAQKLVSPFSLPRKESVVTSGPEVSELPSLSSTLRSTDPYRELPR